MIHVPIIVGIKVASAVYRHRAEIRAGLGLEPFPPTQPGTRPTPPAATKGREQSVRATDRQPRTVWPTKPETSEHIRASHR